MADASVLKTDGGNPVRVRVPSPAPALSGGFSLDLRHAAYPVGLRVVRCAVGSSPS